MPTRIYHTPLVTPDEHLSPDGYAHALIERAMAFGGTDFFSFVLLTYITSSEGLGYNRALYLRLVGPEKDRIICEKGVGPLGGEDAKRNWDTISAKGITTLDDYLHAYDDLSYKGEKRLTPMDAQMQELGDLSLASFPTLNAAIESGQPAYSEADNNQDAYRSKMFSYMGPISRYVAVPMLVGDEKLGAIVADNTYSAVSLEDNIGRLRSLAKTAAYLVHGNLAQEQIDRIRMSQQLAHELRNPMVAVGGLARTIQRELGETSDPKILEALRAISGGVSDMEATVTRYLEQFQNAPLSLEPVYNSVLDLNAIVGAELERRLEHTPYKFTPSAEPLEIAGDELQFGMIIQSMIHAIVSTEGRKIAVKSYKKDSFAHIEMSSEGHGYTMNDFDITRMNGLAELVSKYGGELKQKSVDGTRTFRLTVPIIDKQEPKG